MRSRHCLSTIAAATALFVSRGLAQYEEVNPGTYTDAVTGIDFLTWSSRAHEDGKGAFTFGMALPGDALEKNATEYIGLLQCQTISPEQTGWCGFAHAGHMVEDLLLMAWPHENEVLTSFRYATGFHMPDVYRGNSTITQIRSSVNATNFELIYRCQDCFSWGEEDYRESIDTAAVDGFAIFGFAQSSMGIQNSACPGALEFGFHDNGFAMFSAEFAEALSPKYAEWAALATETVTGTCA